MAYTILPKGGYALDNQAYLGIELGSTRIKCVLINPHYKIIATGSHQWENILDNGLWTYTLQAVWEGVQKSFANLIQSYGNTIPNIVSIGVSGMMHGYLAFDKNHCLLTPFRTWRNTTTQPAAKALTQAFEFNIPQRWSIAHFYQCILNQEAHVQDVDFLTTLAGYVHWQLTGEKVLGIGDASGMFPILDGTYNEKMLEKFASLCPNNINLQAILPQIKAAGTNAGALTPQGALLLDPTGALPSGIAFCPPEGDAGTGMVATNSIKVRTGNISAGTSVFAMVVLEKPLANIYPQIDMVTTPAGKHVAMVHCNNCASDIDAWVNLFEEMLTAFGTKPCKDQLYQMLYSKALEGDTDCGGVLSYNYFSGEPITDLDEGRPLLLRTPSAKFNLANTMRSLLFSAVATLKIGMKILEAEDVKIDTILGHGGFFKTPIVGQQLMAAALNTPISVMASAGEGGPWGMALLAAYMAQKADDETLAGFLTQVFQTETLHTITPNAKDVSGFLTYLDKYTNALEVQRSATVNFR